MLGKLNDDLLHLLTEHIDLHSLIALGRTADGSESSPSSSSDPGRSSYKGSYQATASPVAGTGKPRLRRTTSSTAPPKVEMFTISLRAKGIAQYIVTVARILRVTALAPTSRAGLRQQPNSAAALSRRGRRPARHMTMDSAGGEGGGRPRGSHPEQRMRDDQRFCRHYQDQAYTNARAQTAL